MGLQLAHVQMRRPLFMRDIYVHQDGKVASKGELLWNEGEDWRMCPTLEMS